MESTHHVRPATPDDLPLIVEFCALHAAYEKAEYDEEGKEYLLAQQLFGPAPAAYCLIAEADGEAVGYATYTRQFATWDADFYLYLDCLFIREGQRGKGLGTLLMERIKAEARELNCGHVQWQTPDFNHRAIKFYQRIGAQGKSKERFFLPA